MRSARLSCRVFLRRAREGGKAARSMSAPIQLRLGRLPTEPDRPSIERCRVAICDVMATTATPAARRWVSNEVAVIVPSILGTGRGMCYDSLQNIFKTDNQ